MITSWTAQLGRWLIRGPRSILSRRRRVLLSQRVEPLDRRILLTVYTVPVTEDGTLADRNFDGLIDAVDIQGNEVAARLNSDPAIGDEKAVFEFTLPVLPADELIRSVALRLFLTEITVPASQEVIKLRFFGGAGDGIISGDDLGDSVPLREFVVPATFNINNPAPDKRYDISLSPGFFQSLVGTDGRVSIVMEMQTYGGSFEGRSNQNNATIPSANLTPEEAHPKLMITTGTLTAGQSSLLVSMNPASIAENAGPNVGTVTISRGPGDASEPLVVNLTSTDPSEATVPAIAVIPANAISVTVSLSAIDDDLLDGPQPVQVVATASRGLNGSDPPFADPLFGGENGILLPGLNRNTEFPSTAANGNGDPTPQVAVQPDGRIVTLLTATDGLAEFIGPNQVIFHDRVSWKLTRVNPDGAYDSGFGVDGTVTGTMPDVYEASTTGLLFLSDGKILVFGSCRPTSFPELAGDSESEWFFARYNPDGTADLSFGNNGIVIDPSGAALGTSSCNIVALSDGKFLALGDLGTDDSASNDTDLSVVRYLADGTRDTTFGVNGLASWNNTTLQNLEGPAQMALQPDGKILVVGTGNLISEVGVLRFTADGFLDTEFGSGGAVSLPIRFNGHLASQAIGQSIVVQPDGKIVIAAKIAHSSTKDDLAVVRLTSTGLFDNAFGGTGSVVVLFNSTVSVGAVKFNVALQEDGKVLVAGGAFVANPSLTLLQRPMLVRFMPDGASDESFGPGGIYYQTGAAQSMVPNFGAGIWSVAWAPDGQLIALAASFGSAYVMRFGNGGLSPISLSNTISVTDHETLSVSINRSSISESAGPNAAFGVVVRSNTDVDQDLIVGLSSNDTTEAVAAGGFVVIPAGSQSASFPINAIDDALLDGSHTVTFTASAAGYVAGTAALTVTDDESAGALRPGDILVTRPAAAPNTYEIAEFSPTGVFVRAITTPWGGGGLRPASEILRDLIQDQSSNLYLYNGTDTPYLTSYDPSTAAFHSQNFVGWSSSTVNGAGGIATFHQFVFVSDSNTASGVPAGIVRFDRRDNTVARFSNATGYQDLTVGLNGLLYALNQNQHIDIFDPVTMSLLSSVDLPVGDYRGLAVRADGKILAAGANGTLYLFDANGNQLSTVNSGAASLTDIDIEPGGRVIAGSLAGEVVVTDADLTAPTKFTASTAEAFVAFAIDAKFPVPTVHTSPGPANVLENDPQTDIDTGILVTDDGDQLVGATVTFTNGYLQGLDHLDFAAQNGIQGTFDPSTGTLSLIGVSSVANYQAALRTVSYHTTSDAPATNRTVAVSVSDGINSASATRVIQVTPQNDPPFIFPNQFFFVAEISPNGTPVGTVQASDDDSPVLSGYTIVSGNNTGIFKIDPATGQISVADGSQLDFEARKTHLIGVTVSDGSLTSAPETVTIFVTDENDLPPVITPHQVFSVNENSPQFTFLGTVVAIDKDTVGFLQGYTIVSGNGTGIFGINPVDGTLFVVDGTQLDYETQKVYTLGIQVSDGIHLSAVETIQVNVLDQNDNPPSVFPATFTVAENSVNNTPVGTVMATDIDTVGTLQDYAIVSGNPSNAFAIDAVTGLITVNNSVPLNFETTPVFHLGVTVTDGLHTSAVQTITVQLTNVNESPSLNPMTFSIPELSAGGLVIGTIQATDPDAGQSLTYTITSGNASSAFTLQPHTGVLTVQNGAILDFETTPVYTFTVTVTDNGNPTQLTSAVMTVNLTDVNDAPTIAPGQTFSIQENSPNGMNVGTVAAHDVDAGQSLAFSITGGNTGGAFSINPATGVISVANTTQLDFETTPSYTLTIKVTDNGSPVLTASAPVVIQVLNVNEPPVVTPATFTIPENSPKPTVVGTVTASDQDVGQQKLFSILSGNLNNAFSIHLSLGTITVNNPAALDFETTPTFTLLVRVQDNGSPSQSGTATITINLTDANDAPLINDQSFTISEASAIGTPVGTILATDPDQEAALVYQIIGGDPNGTFALDPATGLLTVANSAFLDFETQPSIPLQVQVTKPGNPPLTATATVTVNLANANDAPVLADVAFTLPENSPGNMLVGTLTATDQDLGQAVTYAITGGNTNGVFQINPSTGELRVSSGAVLDYETRPDYDLSVTVTDNGSPVLSAASHVAVHLSDVNEPPVLDDQSITIPEDQPIGTVLATLIAQNPELTQHLTYAITGGNANNSLAIDPSTGNVSVVNSAILNYEVLTEILLTVQVTDDGQPALSDTATVTIHITDVNEAPHLVPDTFTLAENSPVGTVVGTIPAVDEDAGQHVSYAVTASDFDGLFAISPEGLVTIAKPGLLDFETTPVIHFTITASDDGNPSASASQEYTLQLTNVDEPPEIVLAPGIRTLTKPYAKQVVDSHAFIRDVDTPVVDVANSTVQVKVIEHATKGDKARLLKSKHGDVVFKGKNILYQGTLIGQRIYGKKGAVPLTIHFNGAATQAAVEGVLQKITCRMKGASGATRTLEFSLTALNNGQASFTDKQVQKG